MTITHDTLDVTIQGPPVRVPPQHIQTCSAWTSLYREPSAPLPDMFKHLHYEARTVGKQVVRILPECFLVIIVNTQEGLTEFNV